MEGRVVRTRTYLRVCNFPVDCGVRARGADQAPRVVQPPVLSRVSCGVS